MIHLMPSPAIVKAISIKQSQLSVEIRGRWVPARPYNWRYGFFHRLKLAWLVFTGKMDVLDWEQDPPKAY